MFDLENYSCLTFHSYATQSCIWLVDCGLMNTQTKAHTLFFSFTAIAPDPSSLPLGNIINAHHHSMFGWMVGISVSPSNDLLGSWINYHSSHWWLRRERQKYVEPPLQSNTQAFKEDTIKRQFYARVLFIRIMCVKHQSHKSVPH